MDEVLELEFSNAENRYDGNNPYPHPHLICIRWRKIVDVGVAVDQTMEKEAARQSGFCIISHRLDFYGLCPDCQSSP
jgi:Fur family transcriptional regulator, peroxide stress response regulator